MKLSKMACALTLCLSSSVFAATDASPVNVQPTTADITTPTVSNIDPVTMSTVAGWIIKGAKSAVIGQVKSFLKDALFGPSGPDYVMLTDEALQQIDDIVTAAILTSDVEDMKSDLMSFQDLMEYYNASAQDDSPDLSVLPMLVGYATSLKNHRAFRESYNANAYLLTGSYSLAAALTIAVLAEEELQGQVSHAYVKSVADTLNTSLTALGSKANSYISSNVYVTAPTGNCDNVIIYAQHEGGLNTSYKADKMEGANYGVDMEKLAFSGPGITTPDTPAPSFGTDCTYRVYDKIAGTTKAYPIALYGKTMANRAAYQQRNTLVAQYQTMFKGADYNVVTSELSSY